MTRFDWTYSPWFLLICVIIAGGISWWLYRRDKDVLSNPVRWFLTAVRFTALFIISVLLLEPLMNSYDKISAPPIIAVLQDDSESVVIQKDSNFVKNEFPASLNKLIKQFDGSDIETRFYSFSDRLVTGTTPDSLRFDRSGTNISSALDEVRKLYSNQNLGAVVLISDGISTSGSSPKYSLDEFRQPVYTVLLGDTAEQKDLKIAEVLYNDIAYLGNETPIKVKVRSTGIKDEAVTVSITKDGKLIESKQVQISRANPGADVDFTVKPDTTGVMQYVVHLTEIPGELTMRNNHKAIFINVLETRMRIALFAGSPHPDIGAIRKALLRDDRYQLVEFIHKDRTSFYESPAGQNLADFDLMILHNFPFSKADEGWVKKIGEAVKEESVPIMFFAGIFTDLNTCRPLFDNLAIAPSAISDGYEEVQANFGAGYMDHSTFTFDRDWINLMNSSPPMLRNRSDWRAQGDAKVFATTTIKNIKLDYPMFALRNQLGRKSFVFVGEGIWRMRANSFSETDGFNSFDYWLGNNVQWMVVQEDRRKFKVRPSKQLFTGNELIIFKGQVYDDSYNPVRGAEIKLTVKGEDGKENVFFMNESGEAHYYLEINNLAEGTYQYTAVGKKGETEIGTDQGQFSVGRSSIEHFNLRADQDLLKQIALRTGGKFYHARDLEDLTQHLASLESLKPVVDYRRSRKGFHEFYWVFFLIIGLLGVEWVVRKLFSLT